MSDFEQISIYTFQNSYKKNLFASQKTVYFLKHWQNNTSLLIKFNSFGCKWMKQSKRNMEKSRSKNGRHNHWLFEWF